MKYSIFFLKKIKKTIDKHFLKCYNIFKKTS
nr:MAG TPA: hypothetical protein [Caudoviricetes sp.]